MTTTTALEIMKKIVEISYKEKTTKVSDFEITLRNISSKQEADIYEFVGDMTGTAFFTVLKAKTLSYAIVKMNNEVFEDSEEVLKIKEEIIKTWPSTLIDELYKVYSELCNEIDTELGFVKPEEDDNTDEDKTKTEEN